MCTRDEQVLLYLAEMIRIDSRNNRSLGDPGPREATEEAMADYLSDKLAALGFTLCRQYIAPGRPNLLASRHFGDDVPTLAFNAHMDTVGTEGMSIAPFEPARRDGRVYGRGSCDTKGSLAAMLSACAALVADAVPINVLYIATSAEETGCQGAALLDLSGYRIDGVIVGEPTRNQLVIAHKCHATVELQCRGKAAHGSRPHLGDNAIYKAGRLLNYLETVTVPELAACKDEVFTDGCTVSVGVIAGGVKNNIVPDFCRLVCDFRLLHGLGDPMAYVRGLVARASAALGFTVELGPTDISPAMCTAADHPLVGSIRAVLRRHGLDDTPIGVAYCTDGGQLSDMGIPCVVMGPGDIAVAHSAVEYIEIEQLTQASELYLQVAKHFAGISFAPSRKAGVSWPAGQTTGAAVRQGQCGTSRRF